MPYIKKELRDILEFLNPLPSNPGELNYAITNLVHRYLKEVKKEINYTNLNEVAGVLHLVQFELDSTIILPYERKKRAENGRVSDLDNSDLVYDRVVAGSTTAPVENDVMKTLAKEIGDHLASKMQPVLNVTMTGNPAGALPDNVTALKPGQSKVLTGPIPGDSGGKEVKAPPVATPKPKRAYTKKNTQHQPADNVSKVWAEAAGEDYDL